MKFIFADDVNLYVTDARDLETGRAQVCALLGADIDYDFEAIYRLPETMFAQAVELERIQV